MSDWRRSGTAFVSWNGGRLDVAAEGVEYGFGGYKHTEQVGDRYHGVSGTFVAPFVSFTVTDHAKLDVDALLSAEDGTVTVELYNGKTLVLNNATNTSDRNVKSSDGAIALRFVGSALTELKG